MRKNKLIKIISVLTASILVLLTAAGCAKKPASDNPVIQTALDGSEYVQQEYSERAKNLRKNETVYVNLAPDGTVKKVNVTDWLHTDSPQVRAEDISNLKDIQNVKTLTNPVEKNGRLYWDMDTTDLYYSGVSDRKPPVQFQIKYYLDGAEISAEDLAGKKGNVTIEIKVQNTLKKTVTVMGKNYEISCPMLAAGGMILSEENFSNISVKGGSMLSDGAKQIVFFAGVAGIDESLGLSKLNIDILPKEMLDTTYTITAYTEHFEIGNMMFAVLPLSAIGSIGNGDVPATVDSIKELLSDIETLETALKGLDVQKIIDMLYGDADKISSIMNAVGEASSLYNENEKLLTVLGKYMTEDNLTKLEGLIGELNNTDIESLSKTLSDPKLQALLKLLPQLSASLSDATQLTEKLNDVMPMFKSLSEDLEDEEIRASLENLPETLKKLDEILGVIENNKELLDTVGALASGNGAAHMETIMNTAEKYAGLNGLSSEETETLAGKIKEWLNFGNEYKIFTQCTDNTQSSVMFTYKTDAVKAPTEAAATEPQEETAEENKIIVWLKGLFK